MTTTTVAFPNERIRREIVDGLRQDAAVPADDISVAVSNGVVTLAGWVDSFIAKWAAERVVLRVLSSCGARGVRNLISIWPGQRLSPREIAAMIEDAVEYGIGTSAEQVTAEVAGDRVILRGFARSWVARWEAERLGWSAPGVTSVDNRIVVTGRSGQAS